MSATRTDKSNATACPVHYLAFELSWKSWKLAYAVGRGQRLDCASSRPDTADAPSGVASGPRCWIGSRAATPCSLLNDCHPRPVNAYPR